ncbi:MAG: hypothetical protein J6V44_11485 [Methanobrevibacter sp.]|nr:hypothetical protein [Methanobrevibacter sp.]
MNLTDLLKLQLKSTQEKVVKRTESNNALLEHLKECIENNPDLRFGQILVAFGFVSGDEQRIFYEEPIDVLERVNKKLN